jgi:ankyrin repeat protein
LKFYIKFVLITYVFIGFFPAKAGSYDEFFRAIELDNVEVVTALLQRGFDPDSPSPQGQPALMLAMQKSSRKVAAVLMEWKTTNLSIHNPKMETPLMLAAITNQLDWAKKLIERGADVNQKGWTPLHYAATKGNIEIMRLLIENHAYLDAESPNGTTPLMMAAHYGTPMATKLLLEEGADPRIQNQLGINALEFARKANKPESAQYIEAFQAAWNQKYPKNP